MIQLILHLIGDYVTQSDWMANNKTKHWWPAICHAVMYSLPFLLLGPSVLAFAIILTTHFAIDRWRLARYVVWAKNCLLQPDGAVYWVDELHSEIFSEADLSPEIKSRYEAAKEWTCKWSWENCKATGYPSETPAWLAVWLLIACDNTLHLAINYAAILWA